MASLTNTLLLGAVALAAFYYTRIWYAQRSSSLHHGCQLPRKRQTRDPILGLQYKFQDIKSMGQMKILPDGAALHARYGSTYHEPSIFGTTLKTIDERNIQTVFGLKAKEWGIQPWRLTAMRPFCGEGILDTDGPVWERSRAMFKPAFRKNNIDDLSAFENFVRRFLAGLPRDGSIVDLQDSLAKLFADTSMRFIVGEDLGILSGVDRDTAPVDGRIFLDAFQLSLRACGMRMFLGIFKNLIPSSVTMKNWQVVHKVVDYHVHRVLDGAHLPKEDSNSLLGELARQTESRMELRNHAIQGIMASQDTTAMLVSNTLFLLSRNPTIWDRLRSEVSSASSTVLRLEDMKRFKLLHNILNEALRLFPIFPFLARDALQDTVLPTGGGLDGVEPVYAPAGSRIVADFYSLHRNELIFGPEPEKFDPDRWQSIQPTSWQFVPFGAGLRSCLGQQKALGEASCLLIRMVQMFKQIESKDDRDWAGELQLLAKNHNGCKVALTPA